MGGMVVVVDVKESLRVGIVALFPAWREAGSERVHPRTLTRRKFRFGLWFRFRFGFGDWGRGRGRGGGRGGGVERWGWCGRAHLVCHDEVVDAARPRVKVLDVGLAVGHGEEDGVVGDEVVHDLLLELCDILKV